MPGTIMPISKWRCCYVPCSCIHPGLYNPATGNYDELGVTWHGMTTTDVPCLRRHHNGWIGFCADCGEMLDILIYTSDAAINTIKTIPVDYDLFYACPYTVQYNANGCVTGGHFEQAIGFGHKCDAVSANKYSVRYNANYPTSTIPGYKGTGYTANTIHSYDNNMYYDGIRGQYATVLRKNGYEFIGYKFTGWNTKPDGTGTAYSDGQTVLNLTSVDGGTIQLYAQWTPCGSTLRINPNGGKFDGSPAVQSFSGVMNSTFNASASRVTVRHERRKRLSYGEEHHEVHHMEVWCIVRHIERQQCLYLSEEGQRGGYSYCVLRISGYHFANDNMGEPFFLRMVLRRGIHKARRQPW